MNVFDNNMVVIQNSNVLLIVFYCEYGCCLRDYSWSINVRHK